MNNQKIMPKFKLEVGSFLVSDKRQLKIIDREYRPKTKYKNGLLEHKTRLGVCSCYERFIADHTKDMEITPMITLNEEENSKLTLKPKND